MRERFLTSSQATAWTTGALTIPSRGRMMTGFDATQFGTPRLWLDSRYMTGLGGVNLPDSTAVASWNDLSAGAAHVVQATGSRQPLFRSASVLTNRGLPTVNFDGTKALLTAGNWGSSNPSPATYYAVISRNGGTLPGGAYAMLVMHSNMYFGLYTPNGSTSLVYGYMGVQMLSGPVVAATGQYVICYVANGVSSVETGLGLTDVTGNAGTSAGDSVSLAIGHEIPVSQPQGWRGWIACIVAYPSAHDAATRAAVMAALNGTF